MPLGGNLTTGGRHLISAPGLPPAVVQDGHLELGVSRAKCEVCKEREHEISLTRNALKFSVCWASVLAEQAHTGVRLPISLSTPSPAEGGAGMDGRQGLAFAGTSTLPDAPHPQVEASSARRARHDPAGCWGQYRGGRPPRSRASWIRAMVQTGANDPSRSGVLSLGAQRENDQAW